jgi:hypothetical protein
MLLSIKNILGSLIVLLTLISVNQWSLFPIGNTYINWVVYFIITILFVNGIKTYFDSRNSQNLLFLKLYLFWIIICSIRGIFVAENYWDFKSLIQSSFALLISISVFLFTNPNVVRVVLSKWMFYSLPLFSILLLLIETQSYGYYLVPVSFFTLFLPLLDKKWKVFFLIISLFVIFVDIDARSNVIKFLVSIMFSFLFYYKKLFNLKLLKFIFFSCFFLPLIFLFFGLINVFNVFDLEAYVKGDYTEKKIVAGEVQVFNLKADTRTGLYKEAITSAIKNNYVLIGRTQARGYDSDFFGTYLAEELNTNRYERYSTEVSILNIFTWTGTIGVILYFLIFFRATYLAMFKSNNFPLKVLGLYLVFRWNYAWVEDFNRFDIMNIVLCIFIGMCYSEKFRSMSEYEFKAWFKSILKK